MPAVELVVAVRLAPLPPDLRGAERVRAQRELARACAREAARSIGGELRALAADERGAPLPEGDLSWSIAHAGALVAGAAARAPLGIDLEPLDRRLPASGPRPISAEERALLGDDPRGGFLRLWTAKEAVLKLAGLGIGGLREARLLALEPGGAAIELGGRVHRVRQLEHGGHLLAVACAPDDFELELARLAPSPAESRT